MPTVSLSHFERMAALSSRMVKAAEMHDWNQLVDLERELSALRRSADAGAPDDESDETVALRKRKFIEQMLADQQSILGQVRPWMNDTRKELRYGARSRAVHAAYTAHNL